MLLPSLRLSCQSISSRPQLSHRSLNQTRFGVVRSLPSTTCIIRPQRMQRLTSKVLILHPYDVAVGVQPGRHAAPVVD